MKYFGAVIMGGLWGGILGTVFGYTISQPQYWFLLLFGIGVILTVSDIAHNTKKD